MSLPYLSPWGISEGNVNSKRRTEISCDIKSANTTCVSGKIVLNSWKESRLDVRPSWE